MRRDRGRLETAVDLTLRTFERDLEAATRARRRGGRDARMHGGPAVMASVDTRVALERDVLCTRDPRIRWRRDGDVIVIRGLRRRCDLRPGAAARCAADDEEGDEE